MKILVTGAVGFIGKNAIATLKDEYQILSYDIDKEERDLENYIKESDVILHLAGVNRPKDDKEFETGNKELTEQITEIAKRNNKKATMIMTSSIQAELDNPYGRSKKAAEEAVIRWARETSNKAYVYRLPNVFGKWCKPNYNSVVATFMYNLARDKDIRIDDAEKKLKLIYVDDVVKDIKLAIEGKKPDTIYTQVEKTYTISLGKLAETIRSFKDKMYVPDMKDELTKKLYSTYTSYIPIESLAYDAKMKEDLRGSFTELIKTIDRGQISVNISKSGITKGNHWHHTKTEKFIVVKGEGVVRLRNINEREITEIKVSGDDIKIIDIPVGYTHNITNVGEGDMVTIMWANEVFDPENPDTFHLEV